MIVARRPFVIYDVDAFFACAWGAALVALYLFVAAPVARQSRAATELRAQVRAEEQRLAQSNRDFRAIERETDQLYAAIAERAREVPRLHQRNDTIGAVVALAAEHGLEVSAIVPDKPRLIDERYACSVQLAGRAHFAAFTAFLDDLARRHVYYELESFSLQGENGSPGAAPAFSLAIRLYLLPEEPPVEEAG